MNNHIANAFRVSATLLISICLSACATQAAKEETLVKTEKFVAVANAANIGVQERIAAEVPLYTRINRLWVSERSTPRSAGDALPIQFSRPYVFMSTSALTLQEFAANLQQVSNVSVNILGEPTGAPPIVIEHKGTLRNFLTNATQRFGVTFQWNQGTLEIIQSEVRTFAVPRSAVDVVTGGSAARRDPYVEIEAALKSIAPRSRVVISKSSNSITVVDRPSVMRDIERYMAFDAEQSGRVVMVRWQLINFTDKSNGEVGVDLNYLLSRSGRGLSISGAAGATAADTLKFSVTDPKASQSGSSIVLKLLNESGRATIVRDGLLPIHNNDTRVYRETRNVPYVAESSIVSIPALTTGTSNQTQVVPVNKVADKEIGLDLIISASIHASEEVDLSVDFSLRVLEGFKSITTALVTQDLPEISVRKTTGRLPARHGDSFLMAMDTNDATFYDRRAGFGYQEKGSGQKQQWLLLITPVISKGAL